jgi:hypothetical protein
MRRVFLVVATLMLALSALSAHPMKLRDWDQSPQGYFMTSSESKQWRAVRSDEEAEIFIASFLGKRGGAAFNAEVQKRVAIADQFFINHGLKGSDTLRKLVILFGVPRNVSVSRVHQVNGYTPASPNVVVSGSTQPITVAADSNTRFPGPVNAGTAGSYFRSFAVTFSAKDVPAFEGKDHVVILEVDAGTGKDRLSKRTKKKELDAMIESVAAASIRNR